MIKWSWTWKISIMARTDWWTDELRCLRHHMSQPWTSGQNGTVSLPDSGINFVQVTSILMEFKFGGSDIHLGNSILVSMVYLQILNSASNLGMLLTVNIFLDVIVTQWTLHCKGIPRNGQDKNEMKGVSYLDGCGKKSACVIILWKRCNIRVYQLQYLSRHVWPKKEIFKKLANHREAFFDIL